MKSFFLALLAASAIAAVAAPTASADGYYYGRGYSHGHRGAARASFTGYAGGCATARPTYAYAPRATYCATRPSYVAYPTYSYCAPAPVVAAYPAYTPCATYPTYPTYYTAPSYGCAPTYGYAPSYGYRSYGYYGRPSFGLGVSLNLGSIFGGHGHRRHCR